MSADPELLQNEPFDEAHELDGPDEDVASTAETPDLRDTADSDSRMDESPQRGDASPPQEHSDPNEDDAYSDEDDSAGPGAGPPGDYDDALAQRDHDLGPDRHNAPQAAGGAPGGALESGSEEEDTGSEEEEEQKIEGAYDPADYADLPVGQDIKELFAYITRYQVQLQDVDTRLKPFIPDFIPAVGDIDAMIKIGRPDNVDQGLGLEVLDEPCAAQSDPTILDLQLRSISKTTTSKAVAVKQVVGDTNKTIDSWISSISDLHREKPPQTVNYSSMMPDIETLMQVWPPEFEELLTERKVQLPTADINCTLKEYVSIVCGLCDIPIHKEKRIESLHVLFTLFIEFRNSQHFKAMGEEDDEGPPNVSPGADVMTLDY